MPLGDESLLSIDPITAEAQAYMALWQLLSSSAPFNVLLHTLLSPSYPDNDVPKSQTQAEEDLFKKEIPGGGAAVGQGALELGMQDKRYWEGLNWPLPDGMPQWWRADPERPLNAPVPDLTTRRL